MATPPKKAPDKTDKGDKPADKSEAHKPEPFVNEPSSLDEATHAELRMMHETASEAILFAKNIQWRSVGSALAVYGAFIAIAVFTSADKAFIDLLKIVAIVLACGVVFVLAMYQFWQVNEINKLNAIDRHFSTLYLRISRIKSRREGNFHRYTILMFMIAAVVLGVVVVILGMDQAAALKKPPY